MAQKQHRSKIEIEITLDEEKQPVDFFWKADGQHSLEKGRQAKALFLGLFDREDRETMKLDLWTTDFQMAEMDRFVFHNLNSMADAYLKATNNKDLANDMRKFAQYFGEKTEIIAKSDEN